MSASLDDVLEAEAEIVRRQARADRGAVAGGAARSAGSRQRAWCDARARTRSRRCSRRNAGGGEFAAGALGGWASCCRRDHHAAALPRGRGLPLPGAGRRAPASRRVRVHRRANGPTALTGGGGELCTVMSAGWRRLRAPGRRRTGRRRAGYRAKGCRGRRSPSECVVRQAVQVDGRGVAAAAASECKRDANERAITGRYEMTFRCLRRGRIGFHKPFSQPVDTGQHGQCPTACRTTRSSSSASASQIRRSPRPVC